jgi:hypothetical protein
VHIGWRLLLKPTGAFPMYPYSSRIGIINSREKPHVIAVEPWAEDFTLLPAEELEIIAFGDTAVPWFQVVEREGTSQVYCDNTLDFKVLQAGIELKCGHNRQLAE